MILGEMLSAVGVECPTEYEKIEVNEVVTDTRRVSEGCMFVCIRGDHFDGHDHIKEASEAGASVIVVERARGECVGGAAIISVDDTRHVVSRLYNYRFGEPTKKLKIIGVTGTNGKTSTCLMLYNIFKGQGYICGFIGTVGCFCGESDTPLCKSDLTTPDPEELYRILGEMSDRGVEYVFMEVSSHALSYGKVAAIEFHTAVFTNLTRDHLDFHNDMEEYFSTKLSLFDRSRRGVVNISTEYGKRVAREALCPIFPWSFGDEGDLCAEISDRGSSAGTEYDFVCNLEGRERSRVFVPIAGEFSVMNSLEAMAVARLEGIAPYAAASALAKMGGVDGRMERLIPDVPSDIDVMIDYAHTPDALESLLKSAREFRREGQRITLVFGCGGRRDRGKRREMGRIASALADLVIVTSDNPRDEDPDSIISDILKGIDKEKPYAVIKDRKDAIKAAVEYARHGELVILAGKGHERYEIVADGKRPFDERQIALSSIRRRYEKSKNEQK